MIADCAVSTKYIHNKTALNSIGEYSVIGCWIYGIVNAKLRTKLQLRTTLDL